MIGWGGLGFGGMGMGMRVGMRMGRGRGDEVEYVWNKLDSIRLCYFVDFSVLLRKGVWVKSDRVL